MSLSRSDFPRWVQQRAVKLLPWCISVVVPFCYISGPVTIAAQQDEGVLIGSEPSPTAPDPCQGHQFQATLAV